VLSPTGPTTTSTGILMPMPSSSSSSWSRRSSRSSDVHFAVHFYCHAKVLQCVPRSLETWLESCGGSEGQIWSEGATSFFADRGGGRDWTWSKTRLFHFSSSFERRKQVRLQKRERERSRTAKVKRPLWLMGPVWPYVQDEPLLRNKIRLTMEYWMSWIDYN